MSVSGIGKVVAAAVLVTAVAGFQGAAVFWFGGNEGPFLSRTGLECTALPLLVELVLFVVTAIQLDRLHAGTVADPHSLIGNAFRRHREVERIPPPAKEAWDGRWEDPGQAADRMRSER